MSWHSALHGAAFLTSFTALVAAGFVFARRFGGLRRWGWTAYCVVTGVVAPVIVVIAMGSKSATLGIPFLLAGAVGS